MKTKRSKNRKEKELRKQEMSAAAAEMPQAEMTVEKKRKYRFRTGDFITLATVAALVVFGIIMVFSASYYSSISESGDPYEFLRSDLMWAGIGCVFLIFFALVDYHVWYRFSPFILLAGFVLLALVFTPLGVTLNNATRWIAIPGTKLTMMPGEIAKFCFIFFTAYYLTKYPKSIHPLQKPLGFLLLCGITLAAVILIYEQPNMSTLLTLGMIVFFMMLVAGLHWGWLAAFVGGIAGGLFLLPKLFPDKYWVTRITGFTDPFADKLNTGWQTVQSIYALSSGGLWGAGLGKSVEKALYLPEPQNDFILAIIGEELGFFGCVFLLAVYVFLIWRCNRIAVHAADKYGMLLASGVTIMLALQVLMNYAVVTSSMPNTGVSLPFVSYGGNSLVIFMSCMGLLLNISRHSDLGSWTDAEETDIAETDRSEAGTEE